MSKGFWTCTLVKAIKRRGCKENIDKGKMLKTMETRKYSRSKHWSDIWKSGFKCWNTCHLDLSSGAMLLTVKDSIMFSYFKMILKA